MEQKKAALMEAAHEFAGEGIPVFPLYGTNKLPWGNGHLDATTNHEVIDSWADTPLTGLGSPWAIYTALDFDIKHGEDPYLNLKVWAADKGGYDSRNAAKVKTPSGGEHHLYAGALAMSYTGLLPGLDGKCISGWTRIPPTEGYEWITAKPWEMDVDTIPAWLPDLVHEYKARKGKSNASGTDDFMQGEVHEGGRNQFLYDQAIRGWKSGTPQDLLQAAILQINEQQCRPPLGRDEVFRIVASACSTDREQAEPFEPKPDESLILSLDAFKAIEWPGDFPVLGPFNRGSMNLIGGSSGLGKSWFAMVMCNAVAGGHNLGPWIATPGCTALLVDGELPGRGLTDRQSTIAKTGPYDIISSAHFQRLGRGRLNLMDKSMQDWLVAAAKPYSMVILDNLFGLFPSTEGKPATSVEYWRVVDDLTIRMKMNGAAVVLFDHLAEYGAIPYPNKKGDYLSTKLQGTTSKRWAADSVAVLMRSNDWTPEAPPRFLLSFKYAAGGKVRSRWNSAFHRERIWEMVGGWFVETPFIS